MSRPRPFDALSPEATIKERVRRLAERLVSDRLASSNGDDKRQSRSLDEKILDRAMLKSVLGYWRASLEKQNAAPGDFAPRIVFTNGCFDLLHPGHARYLAEARAEGDLLVVAMNDDAGIAALKGPGRPLLPLRERLKVMAALACTDLVTWFDEPTPIPLLRELRPDLLVKGGDYTVEEVVGHDIVGEWGGVAKVLSVSAGHSTSTLAERMKT